jgi:hypothetical protein
MSVYLSPFIEVLAGATDSFQVVEVSSGDPDGDIILESPIEIEPFSSIEIWTRSSERRLTTCQSSIVCSSTLRRTP